jgi:isopentenyl-diphosphate Delta-isomerase
MRYQKDHVILVSEQDEWLGTMEKLTAHQEGRLHRAFSVFVMNSAGEMLLQQRAADKYHSGGLWSNTCCSHPYPGESTIAAAHRRLQEEMGLDCPLTPLFHLRYTAEVGNKLIESEYDHIYLGRYNGDVHINTEEVQDHKFIPLTELEEWRNSKPEEFTQWFHLAMPLFLQHYMG